MEKGKPPKVRNGMCSSCGVNPRAKGQRYCKEHHNEMERVRRKNARTRRIDGEFDRFTRQWYERIKLRHPAMDCTLEEFRERLEVIAAAEVWAQGRV